MRLSCRSIRRLVPPWCLCHHLTHPLYKEIVLSNDPKRTPAPQPQPKPTRQPERDQTRVYNEERLQESVNIVTRNVAPPPPSPTPSRK